MGLRNAWKAVSTGWVIEYPDQHQNNSALYPYASRSLASSRQIKPATTEAAAVISVTELAPPLYDTRESRGNISPAVSPIREEAQSISTVTATEHTQEEIPRTPAEDLTPAQAQPQPQEEEQPPPPYSQPRQFGPPRPWKLNMNNKETRHWLAEHFLARLHQHDLPAAVKAAGLYRYGNGNLLFCMSFRELMDVDGEAWAVVVWRALGR